MLNFSIKNNIEEVDRYFKQLGLYFPELIKLSLKDIVNAMKKEVLRNNTLRNRTGSFKKSIYAKVFIKENRGKVSIKYKKGRQEASNIIKANVAEAGANIFPGHKRNGFLSFKNNDRWVRTQAVRIPPRPFFERSYQKILSNINEFIDNVAAKLMAKRKL